MSIYLILINIILAEMVIAHLLKNKLFVFKYGGSHIFPKIEVRIEYIFAFVDILLMIILMGLRNVSVGTDTLNYYYFYQSFSEHTILENFTHQVNYVDLEFGYVLYASIISRFTDYQGFQMITASFIYISIFIFLTKKSSNILMSLFIFICFGSYNQSFNITRQWIAISLLAMAYLCIDERNFKGFLFWVLIATFFHKSSLVFLCSYPLRFQKNIDTKFVLFLSICIIIFLFFGNNITTVIKNVFYANYDINRSGDIGLSILINISIFLTFLVFRKNFLSSYSDSHILFYFSAIAILCNALGLYMDLFSRIMIYFKFFYVISIPNLLDSIKNTKNRRILYVSVVTLFFVFYLYSLLNSTLFDTIPYII